ncbi:MAG: SPASM domain-containing protein [Cyclobacteriaceae bacterium]|nr:SPASM domain-containing protein [Cyclobacteriaceae bacterium]
MASGFRDTLQLASGLTPRRVWNGLQVVSSYIRSRVLEQPRIAGLPMSVSIEPTTSCNLRCPECPSGLRSFTRPTGMLDKALFEKVIRELSPTLSYLTFYFQGEPYLHPGFLDMVRFASSLGIYTATSTNAHYLDEERARATISSGLDRLIISLDGTTQETYASYRVGGKLDKVLEGTRTLLRLRKEMRSATPHVVFQFLVVKPNEHQVPDVYALAKEMGVDGVWLKTAQIYDYQKGSPLIPDQEEYSRYRKNTDGTYRIKNELLNHCWKMWHSCVITWDGRVVPCCFDKDAHHVMGDLGTQSFREIWYSDRYNDFRASLLKSRSEIEMCRNCTEGTKVWA